MSKIPVEWVRITVPAGTPILDQLTSAFSGGRSRFKEEQKIEGCVKEADFSDLPRLFFFVRPNVAVCFMLVTSDGQRRMIDLGKVEQLETVYLFCSVAAWYRESI